MMEKKFKILNEEGMHARPAGSFVKLANEFKSKIEIKANGVTKREKSILGIMSLGLVKDAEFTIIINGEDEIQAMEKIESLILNHFNL